MVAGADSLTTTVSPMKSEMFFPRGSFESWNDFGSHYNTGCLFWCKVHCGIVTWGNFYKKKDNISLASIRSLLFELAVRHSNPKASWYIAIDSITTRNRTHLVKMKPYLWARWDQCWHWRPFLSRWWRRRLEWSTVTLRETRCPLQTQSFSSNWEPEIKD